LITRLQSGSHFDDEGKGTLKVAPRSVSLLHPDVTTHELTLYYTVCKSLIKLINGAVKGLQFASANVSGWRQAVGPSIMFVKNGASEFTINWIAIPAVPEVN
jgi:hypothetical protein